MNNPQHPRIIAAVLGGIAGVMAAMLGGVRMLPEHLAPGVTPSSHWTLEGFGVRVLSGIPHYAAGISLALLAFVVVGALVAVSLVALVGRWRSSKGSREAP